MSKSSPFTDEKIEEAKRSAASKANLTGIPHYVLSNDEELWIAGEGARNELWPDVTALYEACVEQARHPISCKCSPGVTSAECHWHD